MMKNKNLIKSIKSDVKKQIQSDIKNSVVKEIYGSSKKEMKKLRKQIALEVQRDLFGKKIKSKKTAETTEVTKELIEKNTRLKDLYSLDFDSKKMGALATGQVDRVKSPSDKLPEALREALNRGRNRVNNNFSPYPMDADELAMLTLPTQAGNFTESNGKTTFPMGAPETLSMEDMLKNISTSSFFGRSLVKVPTQDLSEEKKEEIAFFIRKLKGEVSKLRKDEKNIKYRKKVEGIYSFEFERKANFDLKFNIELNLSTYRAEVNAFEFKIDDFRFDKRQFELIDIIIVLDLVGFNIFGFINEIKYINEIDMEQVSTPTTKVMTKKAASRKPTPNTMEIDKIIFNAKIIKLLKENEISNLGQLMSVEDLTSLKGIGAKTAESINEYLKSNTYGVL